MATYKVPPPQFSEEISYPDWKIDVELWARGILDSQMNKKQKAIYLYQSLNVTVRQTVLSEVTIDEIDHDDGIKNIFTAMDCFYQKDQVKSGCVVLDNLIKYRKPKDLPINKFLIEFNLKMNKVETLGVKIPDAFKAYLLLECANLSQNKKEICRATCAKLTYKDMRAQIEKVGCESDCATDRDLQQTSKQEFSVIKTEPLVDTLYVENCMHCGSENLISSDDDNNGGTHETLYSKNRFQRNYSNQRGQSSSRYHQSNHSRSPPTPNPLNKFGHYTTCDFCKSIYHYLPDCPDCPADIKAKYSYNNKRQQRYGKSHNPTF